MNVIQQKIKRLHHKYGEFLLRSDKVLMPGVFKKKKNLFIYFDYEREFGNSLSNINNEQINSLLDLLADYKIRTTWFTVGKVFDSYPDSIKSILKQNHEIGSHTNSHIALPKLQNKGISSDFETFFKTSKRYAFIQGFHSPRGKWTYNLFNFLQQYNFTYDVSAQTIKNSGIPYYINSKGHKILRFCTVGDDWLLLKRKSNEKEVFEYFVNKVERVKIGHVAGIGFHPWILFSDDHIYESFQQFLQYVTSQDDIFVETASYYAGIIRNA